MRIAFLTTEFISEADFYGGLGNYLFRTAKSLKYDFDQEPIIFISSNADEYSCFDGIKIIKVKKRISKTIKILDKITFKNLSGALSQISLSKSLWIKLIEENKKQKIDIVQATSYNAVNLFAIKEIPSVVRISSFEPLWRKAYEKKLTIKQLLIEYLERKALTNALGIYCPSNIIANIVQNAIKKKVDVIEPPFYLENTEMDYSFYNNNLKDKKYLLFYGTIGAMKGCKEIAEIIYEILKNNELFFVFIGSSENEHSKMISSLIIKNAKEYKERTVFYSPLKHSILYPVIKESIAVVLPSRIDNLPNTCLESMAMGKVVVGTRGASFEQIIEEGKNGFLCKPYDKNDLLKTIKKVLELSEQDKIKIGNSAKERIMQLDPKITVNKLLEYYKKILSEKN